MATATELGSPILLMVEDEEDTAHLVRSHLERARYQVIHSKDGRSAKDLIDTMPPPDLILLDVMLPFMSGLDLLNYIKKQSGWEQLPIVMLTADGSEQSVKQALKNGAIDYILKPFRPQSLAARIGRLLNP